MFTPTSSPALLRRHAPYVLRIQVPQLLSDDTNGEGVQPATTAVAAEVWVEEDWHAVPEQPTSRTGQWVLEKHNQNSYFVLNFYWNL